MEYTNLDAEFLTSTTALKTMAELSSEDVTDKQIIKTSSFLRNSFSAREASLLIEQVRLRKLGEKKFSLANQMLFTKEALEQATAEEVSRWRTNRFSECSTIADLCCSIGSDSIWLSENAQVTGVDLDETRLAFAIHNMTVFDKQQNFTATCGDVLKFAEKLKEFDAFFIDPARRDSSGKRIFDAEQCMPPLSEVIRLSEMVKLACAKTAPGIDYEQIPPQAEAEFISLNGDLREAVLWFGDGTSQNSRRATILPKGISICATEEPEVEVKQAGQYIHEPDKAVIRAHLVRNVASDAGAWQIDPEIAYLSSDHKAESGFLRSWQVEDVMPFSQKKLKQYLRDRKIGNLVIKKRGSRSDIEQLRKKLALKGCEQRVLFLTHELGKPVAVIAMES